jgi:hypothetical protein
MYWTERLPFPAAARDFSLLYSVQSGSGAHLTSYQMGTGGSFPGIKRPGRGAHHSSPTNAGAKNGGDITPFPIRLHSVVLDKFRTGINLLFAFYTLSASF